MRLLTVVSLLVLGSALRVSASEPTVGLSDCAACHDEATLFAEGPHGRAMARVSPALLERSCAVCHGDAAEHLQNPEPENIRRTPDTQACATCHERAAQQLSLHTPGHSRNKVECLDCHASGHGAASAEWLLAKPPFELCGSCHTTEKAAAFLPYAHREGRDPFACTECHSPHGTRPIGRQSILGTGGPCLECHSATAVPHVFEHPPREVAGCSSCHAPHGSPNPRMLTRHSVAALCIECHANLPRSHDITQSRYRICTDCHVAIHGSNRDSKLFDE